MNRRTSIKQLLLAGALGISSFSIFKWVQLSKKVDLSTFDTYKNLIAELAEVIIPRTDTPGAKDVQVEDYILKMIRFCTDHKSQNNFLKGLSDLEDHTQKTYAKTFDRCSKKEKIQIVQFFQEKSTYSYSILNKIDNRLFGASFFKKLKELTVEGYCSSQRGATEALAYDYIPVNYDGCIPLIKNQRSWSTK